MTLNPELKRNLWLELSLERLIAMPVILGLLFWVSTLVGDAETLAVASIGAFHVVVLLWGTRRAAGAVAGELRAGTWDDQRMSPISAWSMAWGKLAGATSYVWYGGAFCLVAFLGARVYQARHAPEISAVSDLSLAISLIAIGLIGQTVALTASLAFLQKRRLDCRLPVTFCQLIGLAVAGLMAGSVFEDFFISPHSIPAAGQSVSWFGAAVAFWTFALLSVWVFLGWALIGLYRLMQVELQYRTRPWAWAGFTLFMMIYVAGLLHDELAASRAGGLLRLAAPFAIAATGVYLIFFLEPKNTVQLRKLSAAFGARAWPAVWRLTPNWVLSLGLVWIVGGLLISTAFGEQAQLPEPVQWLGVSVGEISTTWVLAALLFVCRDILLLLYLNLSRTNGKPDSSGFIHLLVLYGLFPPLLALVGGHALLPIAVPYPADNFFLAVGPVSAQIAALVYICRRAWGRQCPMVATAASNEPAQ